MTIYQFLTICDNLKRVYRTGWLLRGIPPALAENAASHSHTTAILVFLIALLDKRPIDFKRLLLMALIHDLPEAEIGDIPISAQRNDPKFSNAKREAENKAMEKILALLPQELQEQLQAIWTDYLNGESTEAHLVEAADRLATAIHAVQLVRTGYSAEAFKTFIDHAESTIKGLPISNLDALIKELNQEFKT